MKKLKEKLNRAFGGGFRLNLGTVEKDYPESHEVFIDRSNGSYNTSMLRGGFQIYYDAKTREDVVKAIRAMEAAAKAFNAAMEGEG